MRALYFCRIQHQLHRLAVVVLEITRLWTAQSKVVREVAAVYQPGNRRVVPSPLFPSVPGQLIQVVAKAPNQEVRGRRAPHRSVVSLPRQPMGRLAPQGAVVRAHIIPATLTARFPTVAVKSQAVDHARSTQN